MATCFSIWKSICLNFFRFVNFLSCRNLLSTGLAPVEATIDSYNESEVTPSLMAAAAASDRFSIASDFNRAASNSGLSEAFDGNFLKSGTSIGFRLEKTPARRKNA